MTGDLMSRLSGTQPKPADTPPTESKPAVQEAPKVATTQPAAKSEPAKTEPAKPAPKAEAAKPAAKAESGDVNFDDPKLTAKELREHLKSITGNYKKTLSEKDSALNQVQGRLRELEAKKYWTPEDEKKFEELSKGKSTLEAQLYARDYAQSPEYKKNFQDKMDREFAEASEIISSITVKSQNPETGETSERPGTQKDLLLLYGASNLAERKRMAKQMFGDEYQEALDAVRPMLETRRAAEEAVKSKLENYTAEQQKMQESYKETGIQFQKFISESWESLKQADPEIFGESEEDAEGTKLLSNGLSFVDESANNGSEMPLSERAARSAMIRAMAGAFPRVKYMLGKANEQIATLKSELEALRGSDPGNAGGVGAVSTASQDDVDGFENMASKFDNL